MLLNYSSSASMRLVSAYTMLLQMAVLPYITFLISGLALMHIKNKEPLIDTLERINQTIEKILVWLGKMAPIGVYARAI